MTASAVSFAAVVVAWQHVW